MRTALIAPHIVPVPSDRRGRGDCLYALVAFMADKTCQRNNEQAQAGQHTDMHRVEMVRSYQIDGLIGYFNPADPYVLRFPTSFHLRDTRPGLGA